MQYVYVYSVCVCVCVCVCVAHSFVSKFFNPIYHEYLIKFLNILGKILLTI